MQLKAGVSLTEASPRYLALENYQQQLSNRQGSAQRVIQQNMQSTTRNRNGVAVSKCRANSYKENSARRIQAW